MERPFTLKAKFTPKGDQPRAIEQLVEGIKANRTHQVLLGVTGSGKTFTLANVIERVQKPTLIIAHNKTLAAQLYEEFREFFPDNAVEYFVSYYDFYQPEAYLPSTNTYIEKDAQINEEIDRMRHSATHSLLTRKDVIIISSVSFIYGLGSPEVYRDLTCTIVDQVEMKRNDLLRKLIDIQYSRNDVDFSRGTFRVRGDTVEIFPAYEEERAVRVEFFGDFIESITEVDPLRGVPLRKLKKVTIYPASHYVTEADMRKRAIVAIQDELLIRLQQLKSLHKLAEAQRLEQRTLYDIEMMQELGYCKGIENYSRHLTGRDPGAAPPTLMEYFEDGFLLVLDESHVTVPQLGAMYRGDRARKSSLVEFGFRLPSALDNRPLNFDEFKQISEAKSGGLLYVSATPADYELATSGGEIVEQIIRPTGLLDPVIHMRPAKSQVQDLVQEVQMRLKKNPEQRILVTTLTKKSAEDLTTYMLSLGLRVKYLHSDVDTLDRIEILRDLRQGIFDILIGINLLREGLDLPEVALVAILDADKEGFLRSKRSLIQTIGRAARNSEGTVILYADKMTDSIDAAVKETDRRRNIQIAYNTEHGITPTTIIKSIGKRWDADTAGDIKVMGSSAEKDLLLLEEFDSTALKTVKDVRKAIDEWHKKMLKAAKDYQFEDAAKIRDRVKQLKQLELKLVGGE